MNAGNWLISDVAVLLSRSILVMIIISLILIATFYFFFRFKFAYKVEDKEKKKAITDRLVSPETSNLLMKNEKSVQLDIPNISTSTSEGQCEKIDITSVDGSEDYSQNQIPNSETFSSSLFENEQNNIDFENNNIQIIQSLSLELPLDDERLLKDVEEVLSVEINMNTGLDSSTRLETSEKRPMEFNFRRSTPRLEPRSMSDEFNSIDAEILKRKVEIQKLLDRIIDAKRQHSKFSERLQNVHNVTEITPLTSFHMTRDTL